MCAVVERFLPRLALVLFLGFALSSGVMADEIILHAINGAGDSITVPPGDSFFDVSFEVISGTPKLARYQVQLNLENPPGPGPTGIWFTDTDKAANPVFPNQSPLHTLSNNNTTLDVHDLLPFPNVDVEVKNGAGLFRVFVHADPGSAGSYPVAINPNPVSTNFSDSLGNSWVPTFRNGTITVTGGITPGMPPSNPGSVLKPVNPNTTPPSGQVKRWDGNSWHPVSSWSNNGIDPSKPTVVIAHGWGGAIDGSTNNPTMISNIAAALFDQDSSANILAWDWREQAAVSNGGLVYDIRAEGLKGAALCATRGSIQGVSLAHELQNLHIGNDNLQLIGHSNGGAVVGAAGSELARSGQTVKRITTLDTPNLTLSEVPFAGTLVFPNLSLKSTTVNAMQYVHPEAATQVEVYYSGPPGDAGRAAFGFGAPIAATYSNVFNGQVYADIAVDLLSPSTWDNIDHLRIPARYSKGRSGANPGQDQFVAAIDWSILSPNATTNPWRSANAAEQGFDTGVFKTTSITAPASIFLAKRSVDDFTNGNRWFGQHASIVAVDNNGNCAAQLRSGSDGYLFRDVSIPADAYYLTFDLKIQTPGSGDFLTVSLGDELLFYKALDAIDGDFKTVDPIYVGEFAGQTETLLFALNHVGSETPSILIDNVTFSAVPEPSSIVLFSIGVISLLLFARKRRGPARWCKVAGGTAWTYGPT